MRAGDAVTLTDADIVNADGILRAAKKQGHDGFRIDIDFALALIAEVRSARGIDRRTQEAWGVKNNMQSVVMPRVWVERALAVMVKHGTHEEFDYPGDAPESCGWWCDICKQHINDDDRSGGHAVHCPVEIFRMKLEK